MLISEGTIYPMLSRLRHPLSTTCSSPLSGIGGILVVILVLLVILSPILTGV